jgi:UDP-2,3-diacylglucosamine pyrophosphatase LpxH
LPSGIFFGTNLWNKSNGYIHRTVKSAKSGMYIKSNVNCSNVFFRVKGGFMAITDGIIDDLRMIVIKTPEEFEYIDIYPIADIHCGALKFDHARWTRFKKLLAPDNAYTLIAGDIFENATKGGKSNVYTQTMNPHQQKVFMTNELYDIREKILCIMPGNHDDRSEKEVGLKPIYDIASSLGITERYRDSICFLKIGVGTRRKQHGRQTQYAGCVMHRTNKTMRYHYSDTIDNLDFYVTGHTHQPEERPLAKYYIDLKNNTVTKKPVQTVVAQSFLGHEPYAMKMAYRASSEQIYKLRLFGNEKRIEITGFYI